MPKESTVVANPQTEDKTLGYTFTKIADTTEFLTFEFTLGEFSSSTVPAINAAGEVAFWGVTPSKEAGIFVGDGSSLKTIVDTSGEFGVFGIGPSINNAGTVAFLAGFDAGDAGYFTGDGTTISTIADSSGSFDFQRIPTVEDLFGEPVINNRGTVAFRADLDVGGKGIFSNTRGVDTTIADATSGLSTFGLGPDINQKGTVVFSGGTFPINEFFQNTGIFTGREGTLTTIADTSDSLILFGSTPAINDPGTVAFTAGLPSGGFGVFIGDGKSLTTVADSNGPISFFRGVDINNAGTIAYLADLDTGGRAVFVGEQQVVATGDSLLGSTVVDLNFLNKGLNNDGSVAFWASLEDGGSGIFRADVNGQKKLPSRPDDTTPFSPKPLYEEIGQYTTTIAADGDPADIYFPLLPDSTTHTPEFPIALLLQGALVNKSDYSNFAATVAGYGFVVVVPNNERTLTNPATGQSFTGFFPEQEQVNDVLDQMIVEDANPASPVVDIIDTEKLGLLGHSFGGAVGLAAIQDICVPGICSGDFTRPPELMAGIFYGTNFRNPPETGEFPPIDNHGIPSGLIAGTLDGVAALAASEATYDQILNPPKALITVEGANHYGITNEDNVVRDPIRPTLDQATATETIARWSALFLRAHLVGDSGAFGYVYNTGDALDPNVSVISQTQPILDPVSVLGI